MSDWLDTETKAILQGVPPGKLAPPDALGYTLVLLSRSPDRDRLQVGLAKARCLDADPLPAILVGDLPQILARAMTLEDALLGQFELACCDSVSVFLRDEVVTAGDRGYLAKLYSDLLTGEEFGPTAIEIRAVPNDDRGRRFLDQFIGTREEWVQVIGLPLRLRVMGKKARVMCHWARKIGADVRVEA
jgi:hypothetical protein